MEVTDEEYARILKYNKEDSEKNTIANTFKIMACIVFILGFIAVIILGNQTVPGYYLSHSEFSFVTALIVWTVSFVQGMLFLGFAEIIQLLYVMK